MQADVGEMTDHMKDLEDLIYDMKVVAGARFAMASRLYFSAKSKRFLLNGVTSISIFISAGLLVSTGARFPVDAVAAALVGISIFSLWMNLDRSEGELIAQGDQARVCAKKINDIAKRAQHGELDKEGCLNKYQQIIDDFDLNHGHFDRQRAIYLLKGKFKKASSARWHSHNAPWVFLCLWYPMVFAGWSVITVILAYFIVQ
jgi:hypothetical protein